MKKTVLFLTLTGLTTLIITSCSKKSDSPALSLQNVTGTYKMTAYTLVSAGVTIDAYSKLGSCERDDLLKLNADSTYNYKDAGTVCSPDGSYDGTWKLSGNYFIVDGSDSSTVTSFNGSTLVLATSDYYNGAAATFTSTYTKQ